MMKRKIPYLLIMVLCPVLLHAQAANDSTVLTLGGCLKLAREHYPLLRQHSLIQRSKEYTIENAAKGYLPQLSVNGQATYQSDVTGIPLQLPGMNIPALSKDQYRIYGEISQVVYDGGVISQQQQYSESAASVEQQKIEVELYRLNERITQLYFGILLLDEQLNQTYLLVNDIELGIRKAESAFANGTMLKSNIDVLKAELLKAGQRITELKNTRRGYLDMLGLFIHGNLGENTKLETPEIPVAAAMIRRPELELFSLQDKSYDIQLQMISAKTKPRLQLFLQGGYGRPALNMLSNNFETYYIGGVKLGWNLSGFYTRSKEKMIIDLNRQQIVIQKELFLFNTSYALKQQDAELSRLRELLASDEEIIGLRTGIKKSAYTQWQNGVITASDYLREINAEDQARQNKVLHGIQLLMWQYNQQITTGNINN